MIVPQAEINRVQRGLRRQMMLPMERGAMSELLPCPVELGACVRLQSRPFEKSTRITVIEIAVGTVADLSDAQAQRQGYASVQRAHDAWRQRHSIEDVWILSFARGDHSAFFHDHAEQYLKAKGVGLTRDPNKGVRTEPAVTTAEQLELARRARDHRDEEQRVKLKVERRKILAALDAMEGLELGEEAFKDLRYIRRRLARVDRTLGIAA